MTSDPGKTLLALSDEQVEFNDVQRQALAQLGMTNTNRADLAVFFHQVRRTGLDPFLKQIYLITRLTWNPDTRQREPKATIQTGIDGYRLVASRAAAVRRERLKYAKPLWLDDDGQWLDYWIKQDPPLACQQTVSCGDAEVTSTLRFWDYAATKDEYEPDSVGPNGQKIKGQKTGNKVLSGQWGVMPSHMIAKCTQADALRTLFPQDLGGLYIEEEMERVLPNGREVIDVPSAPVEPTGNDWLQMIADAPNGDALNEVFFQLQASGEMDNEIRDAITARGRWFRDEATRLQKEQEAASSSDSEPDTDSTSDPA